MPYNRNTPSYSSSYSTSTKSYFNLSGMGDSDDESSDAEDDFPIFSRKVPIKAGAMTIQCRDVDNTKPYNIKGGALIKIVAEKIEKEYAEFLDFAFEYDKDDNSMSGWPYVNKGKLNIQEEQDWLKTLGGWKGMMPKTETRGYFGYMSLDPISGDFKVDEKRFTSVEVYNNGVDFLIINDRIHLPKGFAIGTYVVTNAQMKDSLGNWRTGIRTDLSYTQINNTINFIKNSYHLTDIELADLQLDRFKGLMLISKYYISLSTENSSFPFNHRERPFPTPWLEIDTPIQQEIIIFLDYINALMFGIEASGLNSALVTSIMTLELIKNGQLTYKDAFASNDDGGIYPYATFSNNQGSNKGTYSARSDILLASGFNPSMKPYRTDPCRSPVAIKEAIIIRQWLKSKEIIVKNDFWHDQLTRIEQAIDDLISYYFSLYRPLVNIKKVLDFDA
jgi:hypothetical protein